MSPAGPDNVELVRTILARPEWDMGRFREIVPEVCDPDVEWSPIEATETVYGHEAVIAELDGWFEAMEDQVYTFKDGKVLRFEEFSERDEALAAAGIER